MNPVKAIRAKCLDCCGDMPSVVADCHIVACALHPFRMGKNPFRKIREKTEAERATLAKHLAVHRLAKSTLVATKKRVEGLL